MLSYRSLLFIAAKMNDMYVCMHLCMHTNKIRSVYMSHGLVISRVIPPFAQSRLLLYK